MSLEAHPYNPTYPSQYLALKSKLEDILKHVAYTRIAHIAGPSLSAKPSEHIQVIVARPHVRPAIAALVSAGFVDMGELGSVDRWCVEDPEQEPGRDVYICVEDGVSTRNHLVLRGTLQQDEAVQAESAEVKREVAAEGMDSMEYGEAKSVVVGKALVMAGMLSRDEEMDVIAKADEKAKRFRAVRTGRLMLREFEWADEEAYFRLESREEVVRYQTWGPRTREQASEEVAKIVRGSCAVPRTHVELAVEYEGVFIGRVGANVKREGTPHADLWFSFLPEWQGKGLAAEAMRAFIPLLGRPLELEIECDPRNTGSWKLAERLAFERLELTERAFECKGEWVGSLVYRKQI
jgi:RimJ/RimL family protein N-acetyltransferase/GrpB-like predicted nucleotidyltransferase (UPF0157 family)